MTSSRLPSSSARRWTEASSDNAARPPNRALLRPGPGAAAVRGYHGIGMAPTSSPPSNSALRLLLGAAAVGVLVLVLKTLSAVLIPFLQAGFVAILASYPVSFLERKRVPRALAAIGTVVCLLAVIVLIATLLATGIARAGADLPRYEARIERAVLSLLASLEEYGLETPPGYLLSLFEPGAILKLAANLVGQVGGKAAQIFFVMLIAIYALLDAPRLRERMDRVFANDDKPVRSEGYATVIYRYLIIKTIVSIGTGGTAGLLLALIGVDYALLWGLLAFLLNYIPQIGSIIAALLPVLLALIMMGPLHAVLTLLAFLVANFIFGNVLEPRLLGERFGLPVTLILFSLALWGSIFGITGFFLAVPLTMAVIFGLERYPEARPLAHVLGGSTFELAKKV